MGYKGSEWRKWDLHVHTPKTKLNDNYRIKEKTDKEILDIFITRLEESDIQVIGITDYFSIDNFINLKKRYSELYAQSKKVLLPNIELRLEIQVNKQSEEVHLHLLFDTNQETKISKFLQNLKLCTTKANTTHYKANNSDLTEIGFDAASTNLIFLKEALKEQFGIEKPYYIIGVCSGAGSARADSKSPRKMFSSDEIDKFCDMFFGKKCNQAYFLNEDRYELDEKALSKPVLSCSDCHSFEDIEHFLGKQVIECDVIVKDVCWVKSDPTFEGLKQILFEPETRLAIQESKPIEPLHKIKNLVIKLPKDIQITNKINEKEIYEDFCLAGNEYDIDFNPFFNCFIGGRGSGKSSILNLIQESIKPLSNSFYQDHPLKESNNKITVSDYVQINNGDSIDIEYLGQNEIEEFAIKADLFTRAIFERIKKRDTEKVLEKKFAFIEKYAKELASISDLYKRKKILEKSLKSITHEISINNSIISSYNDVEYKKYIREIELFEKELQYIQDSKNRLLRYKQIVFNTLSSAYIPASTRSERSVYDNILFDFSRAIEKLIIDIENIDFSKEEKQEKELAEKLRTKKLNSKNF